MNSRTFLQLSSLLVAIGLISAKSLPEDTPKLAEQSDIVEIPVTLPADESPESQEQQELIHRTMAPWIKLQELLVTIGDKLQEKANEAGQKMKTTANTLSDAIRDFVLAKLEAKKKKKELRKKLVEEYFMGHGSGQTEADGEVVIVTLAPHLTELDEEQNSVYYRK